MCVYSAQKPMGRPRKRAHNEVEAAPENHEPNEKHPHVDIVPPFDTALGLELDMSFLDFENADMNFFDIIDTNFTAGPDILPSLDVPSAAKKLNTGLDSTWMGDFMGPIDFDSLPQPSSVSDAFPEAMPEISPEDIEHILAAEIPEKMPSLSPPASHDVGAEETTPSSAFDADPPPPPPTCPCLDTLYMAINSLRVLPNEVGAAMGLARTASRYAHMAALCNVCGNPPLVMGYVPPIASFQTLMMLGALLPTLANAYTRILTMVDAAAAKADAEHRKINFALHSYGGLWGPLADDFKCSSAQAKLMAEPLEPSLWRLTVRALLKIDVYGMQPMEGDDPTCAAGSCSRGGYKGLKDIITLVEERSRKRHKELDMALASGLINKPEGGCPYNIGDEPPCMKIINVAKQSIDQLVIP